jgi:hypothetical protein
MMKKLMVFLAACLMVLPGALFAGTMSARAASGGVIAVEAFTVNGDFILPPTSFSCNGRSVADVLNELLGYNTLNLDVNYGYGMGVVSELYSVQYGVADAAVRTEISNEAKSLGITIRKAPAYADSGWLQNNDFADGSRWKLVVNDRLMSSALGTYYPADGDVIRLCFSVDGLGQDLAISNSPLSDVFAPANRDALYRSMAEYADMVNAETILGDSYDDYVLGVARDLASSSSTISEANLIMQDMIGNPSVVESIENNNSDGAEEPAETEAIEPDESDDTSDTEDTSDTTYDPDDPNGTPPDDTDGEWELMDYSVVMDGEYITDATEEYLVIQVREYPDGRSVLDGKTNTAGAEINLTALKVSGAPYNLEDGYGDLVGTRERDQAGYVDPYAAEEGDGEETADPEPWTFNMIELDDGRYAFADSNGNAIRDANGQPLAYGNIPDEEDTTSYDPDDPNETTTPDLDVVNTTSPPYTNGPTPPGTTVPSVPAAPTGVNAMLIIISAAVVGGALLIGLGAVAFGKVRHHR